MWTRPSLFHLARTCGALLVVAAAVALTAWVLVKVLTVTLAVFIAGVLTCLLWPLARRLERWRVPRSLASLLSVLLTIGLAAGALAWILPKAASEIAENGEQLTANVKQLWASVADRLPEGWMSLKAAAENIPSFLQRNMKQIVAGVGSGIVRATEVLGGLLLALVLTFFFLRDGKDVATRTLRHLSEEKRQVFEPALLRAWVTLRAWIRGAAIIALVDALGIGIGLAVLGVPLAFPVALLTFLGGFIPVLGATAAGAVAILVAWATGGTSDALITLAIVIGVQQLEGNVLEPLVMGKSVPLHPATVLIAVTAGALLGGVAGAFAAVPLAAVSTAFLQEVHRRSEPADHVPPEDRPDEETASREEGPEPAHH